MRTATKVRPATDGTNPDSLTVAAYYKLASIANLSVFHFESQFSSLLVRHLFESFSIASAASLLSLRRKMIEESTLLFCQVTAEKSPSSVFDVCRARRRDSGCQCQGDGRKEDDFPIPSLPISEKKENDKLK